MEKTTTKNIKVMKTIGAKVDVDLYEKAKKVSHENGLTVSAMLKQAFQTATIKDLTYERELIRELRRIGNNLNQIGIYANQKKVLDRQVLSMLSRIESDLKETIL